MGLPSAVLIRHPSVHIHGGSKKLIFYYFRFNVVFDSSHASMAEANRRHRLPTESHAAGYDHHTFRLDSPVTDRP
jgi:hypothetical protein